MRMSKKIFALFALAVTALLVAALAASCSNMMEELKPKASGPALFPLSIKDGPTFSDGLVTIVVNGEVPDSPKPKMTYKLPDGKTVELEGTVVKNSDGTSTIKYDMNPVPKDLTDGEIEITLEAKGYAPTKAKVDYVAPKPLDVTASDMKNPDGIVLITIKDDIPATPAPTVTYLLPDGTPIEIEGTVAQNPDGTKTLTFDLNPIPQELQGGTLPLTVTVPGYHLPTDVTVDYIPEPKLELDLSGMPNEPYNGNHSGESDYNPKTCDVYNSQADGLTEPSVNSNYHDNLDIKTEYEDENGNKFSDFEAVKEYIKDPANHSKPVHAIITATPNPNCGAPNDWPPATAECWIVVMKNQLINGVKLSADYGMVGVELTAKGTIDGHVYSSDDISWKWFVADNQAGAGAEIDGAETNKFTPTSNCEGKWIYAQATHTYEGQTATVDSNRVDVMMSASIDVDIGIVTFDLQATSLGANKFKFEVTTNLPTPLPTIYWYINGAKQTQTGTTFDLDLVPNVYDTGSYSVMAMCKNGVQMHSQQAVVQKKQNTTAPDLSAAVVTDESAFNAKDGSISDPSVTPAMEYSTDGGTTWKSVAEVGIINGLSVGQDWQAAPITVLVRYAETETSASSPTASAQLGITKYTVSASATDGTLATNYAIAPAGVTVTLTASADPHCQFVADSISAAAGGNPVTLAQSGTTATFTMPQANVTATAAFERDKFALTYSVSGEHGIIASVKDSAGADIESGDLLEWGTGVTISFSPETNYVVKTLTVNGTDKASSVSDNKYDFEMLPDNTYINAEFGKAKFALTLNAGSNGSLSASPSGDIEWGTSVTVTITPNANYVLDTFKYDGTTKDVTNNKYTFTMPTKAITVSATFKEDLVFATRDTGVVVVYNNNNTGAAAYNYVTASNWNDYKTKYQNAGWKAVGVAFYNYEEGVMHPNCATRPGPENIGDQKWYMIAFDKNLSENTWFQASDWANSYEKEGLTGWKLPEMMWPPEVYDTNPKPSKKMDQVIKINLDTINSTLQTLGEPQIPIEAYWSNEASNTDYAGLIDMNFNVSNDSRGGGRKNWSYPKVLLVHVLP